MEPLIVSPSTLWAETWKFDGDDGDGDGGYIGLLDNSTSTGDTAIFSLFGGTAGTAIGSTTCVPDPTERAEKCTLPYSFSVNDYYRFDVSYVGTSGSSENWEGEIYSFSTGVETPIATISVPASDGDMVPPVNFSEFYGAQQACGSTGTSEVHWTPPAANGDPTEGYEYYSTYDDYSYGGDPCSGAYVIAGGGSQPYVDVKLGGQYD
jgi:hypothetical protein